MKRIKRLAVALLGIALIATPTMTSCGQGTETETPHHEAQITGIEISAQPTKLKYEVGDIFDPTGMVVNALYDDGSKKEVKDYTYNKNPLSESDTKITISYKGKTATVNIEVKFVLKVTGISVEVSPTKTKYVVGETFDPTGMKIVAVYNDNTKKVITDYTYDKKEPLTLEDKTVTIKYENFETTVSIIVEEEAISGIKVTKLPEKLAYIPGEAFDPKGIEVSTITNSGTLEVVDSSKLTFEGGEALTLETTEVLVMYNEIMSTSIPVFVSESRLTKIEVTRQPNIKNYVTGQRFDTVGMEVTATFEDESKTVIDNSRLNIDKTDPLTLEDTKVTITLGGFKAVVDITITEAVTTVNVDAIKTVRIEGEHINTTKASMRPDFIAAGRTFIEIPNNEADKANTSNGANICGYNPGSIFEIPIKIEKKAKINIVGRMSHSDPNYNLKDGFKFNVGEKILTPEDFKFEFHNRNDYWNWKEFLIGEVELEPGDHTFAFEVKQGHPNIDCFDFIVTEYDGQKGEKVIKEANLLSGPTKTKYEIGEKFDPSGIQLEVKYTNFSKEIVTDFTFDKTEPLTISDEFVTLKFKDKEFIIPITVGKEYGFKILNTGAKVFEAENFNIEGTNAELSSDGKAIDFTLANTELSFSLYSHEASKVKLFAKVRSDVDGGVNDLFKFTLNDTKLEGTCDTFTKGTWNEVSLGEVELTKGGEYTFSVESLSGGLALDSIEFFTTKYGDKEAAHELSSIYVKQNPSKLKYLIGETFDPTDMIIYGRYTDRTEAEIKEYTIDKTGPLTADDKTITIKSGEFTTTVAIQVAGPMFEAVEATTYRVEAEKCDLSGLVNVDGASFIENPGDVASGGQSLGHIHNGKITIMFSVTEEMSLSAVLKIAKYEAVKASDMIDTIVLDGQVINFEDVQLGRVNGNDFFNFKDVKVDCGLVTKGVHEFTINLKAGPNIDCFDFTFTK